MKNDESKTLPFIRYKTNFYINGKSVYKSECDFEIVRSRIDFDKCKIIKDVLASGVNRDFKINSIESVDMKVSTINDIIPQSLANPTEICKNCKLKHHER